MTFLDRVREKLKDSHRQRYVDHFEGSDTQKVFAGLEVLAEDIDKLAAEVEALRGQSIPFTDLPAGQIGHEPCTLAAPSLGPKLVDKPTGEQLAYKDKSCERCGAIMEHVHPARKYCDTCKGARR